LVVGGAGRPVAVVSLPPGGPALSIVEKLLTAVAPAEEEGSGGRPPNGVARAFGGRLRRNRQPVSTWRLWSLELLGETVPRPVSGRADGWWDVVPGEHCH
jgi:hypothetical protein